MLPKAMAKFHSSGGKCNGHVTVTRSKGHKENQHSNLFEFFEFLSLKILGFLKKLLSSIGGLPPEMQNAKLKVYTKTDPITKVLQEKLTKGTIFPYRVPKIRKLLGIELLSARMVDRSLLPLGLGLVLVS